jgi:hypothetical protein
MYVEVVHQAVATMGKRLERERETSKHGFMLRYCS